MQTPTRNLYLYFRTHCYAFAFGFRFCFLHEGIVGFPQTHNAPQQTLIRVVHVYILLWRHIVVHARAM